MIRELFLLQSSDWGSSSRNKTVAPYAWARIRAHVHRLRHLGYLIEKPSLDEADLAFVDDVRRATISWPISRANRCARPTIE